MVQSVQQVFEHSQDLVHRIFDGDQVAESELIVRYERGVRLILLKRTGNPQLAKDLCQDTFIITLRKIRAGKLKNPSSLAAFIGRTAVNISIQHFRKEKRYVYPQDGIFGPQVAHNDKKDEELDRATIRGMLENVMKQLAVTRDREILRRFYLSDDDKEDICGDLQLSSAHFDRVLYRAKQRMRQLIDKKKGLKKVLFGGLLDD